MNKCYNNQKLFKNLIPVKEVDQKSLIMESQKKKRKFLKRLKSKHLKI